MAQSQGPVDLGKEGWDVASQLSVVVVEGFLPR